MQRTVKAIFIIILFVVCNANTANTSQIKTYSNALKLALVRKGFPISEAIQFFVCLIVYLKPKENE